ncbi:hypothetical protein ATANTOWER_006483 [Ataeniobius toweri]|uniref:Uncharacterized protein n=1 Tax=Ataeniobius toweri TaxID=208326 RepID=A0ABU7CC44_9TELE|nr:hypothetical protein [Ataeniobius toweri]
MFPHLDLSNRAACQNVHTWCSFFCLSPFSISPTLLSDKRMGLCANKKLHQADVHSFTNFPFTQCSCILFSSLFFFPLTKTRFIHWLHLPTAREHRREVQNTPSPACHTYLLFFSLLEFPRPSAKLFLTFVVSLNSFSSATDKGIV